MKRAIHPRGVRRAVRVAAAVGALVSLLAGVVVARRMPVFAGLDECYHVDYVLKLGRGVEARPDSPLEADVRGALEAGYRDSEMFFNGRLTNPRRLDVSYQCYHPPLAYWLGGLVARVTAGGESGIKEAVQVLRGWSVVLAAAGRGLLFLGIAQVSVRAAFLAWPLIFLVVLPSFSRFSNDSLCLLLGCLAFYLVVRRVQSRGTLIGAALALMAAALTKQTALILAFPAVAAVAVAAWREPVRLPRLLVLLVPGLLVAGGWEAWNAAAGRGFGGTAHLVSRHFPAASMDTMEAVATLFGTPSLWLRLHGNLFVDEMPWHGVRGPAPMANLALLVIQQLGFVLLFLSWLRAEHPFPRSLCVGLTLLVVEIVAIYGTATLGLALGRVHWTARQYAVVQFLIVAPMAIGWAVALRGGGWRGAAQVAVGAALTVACVSQAAAYLCG